MATTGGITWSGFGTRFLLALLLVYATWNPTGVSFTHWALLPIFGVAGSGEAGAQAPVKFLLAVVLVAGWVLYLQATRRSLGAAGAALVAAIAGGVVWLLASWGVGMQGPVIAHVVLVILSLVLAMGMSWSHVSRRMSGQVDTDAVE